MKKLLLLSVFILSTFWAWAQTSGGPDAYGYTWKNSSHNSSPPTYAWVDITTKGTEITGLADDNVKGPFNAPAGFRYYWYPITQFWVGSNGYVSFNGANIAAPFPSSIPLAGGANDWLGAHLSDLNFSGANNNAECWYYTNNDSIVISFINVPYWVLASPGYSGSNTFQVIISSLDSSITYNYKSMNAGVTPTPIDNAVGIENNTGALGLQTLIDVVPGNSFTIKYYYPANVTYSVKDGGINWNNNDKNGGYFVPVSNNSLTFKSNVKNFGNQNLTSFTVTDTIYLSGSAVSNGISTIGGLAPGDDSTITFSNTLIAQFPGIYKFASRVQGIPGDLVAANNRKVQKVISINTNQTQYALDYSDGGPEGAALSWNGGNGGIAIYVEPPVYPVKIEGSKFHISANGTVPVGFSAIIYDDSGPNGGPGNTLDSVYVAPSNVTTGAYNTVLAQNNIYLSSGGVYVVWYMGGASISLSRDLTQPSSARSYELLGSAWAEYRDRLTEDFLIGLLVSNVAVPKAKFSIDSSQTPLYAFTDLSTLSPTQWLWDFGTNNDTSILQNPTYKYKVNGTYTVCLTATDSLGGSTTCKTFNVNNANIGLEEDLLEYHPFVYPNPAGDMAFIDYPANVKPAQLNVVVYNIYGQALNTTFLPVGDKLQLNTQEFKKGVYIFEMKLIKGNEILAKGKFIVE